MPQGSPNSVGMLASAALAAAMLVCAAISAADDAPANPAPTFARDVAPIFQAHCQTCHRPGEAAPMSLLTYEEARPWAKSIAQKVQSREMPPWHADPAHGLWANDRKLSETEIETILAWVRGGAPLGDAADLPPPLAFTDGWNIGEPDVVVYIADKPRTIAADVEDQYQVFVVDPGFKEDFWVDAVEVRPGNRAAVHHILAMLVDPIDGIRVATQSGGGWIGAMAPGRPADIFTDGRAKFVRAGSKVGFEVHYHKEIGVEMTDRSMIGLRIAKAPVEKMVSNMRLNFDHIKIPPGAANHRIVLEEQFQQDVHFLTIMPHMHLRARSMRLTAHYPNGGEEILLNVPRYDFNWQTTYVYSEPKSIPAGTTIRVDAVYDNSANNPANPDPTAEVLGGKRTIDEMMTAFIDYTVDAENIPSGHRIETLPTKHISVTQDAAPSPAQSAGN